MIRSASARESQAPVDDFVVAIEGFSIEIKADVPSRAMPSTSIHAAHRCGVTASMKKLKGLPVLTSLRPVRRVPSVNRSLAVGGYRRAHNENTRLPLFTFGRPEASLDWIRGEVSERLSGQARCRDGATLRSRGFG